MKRQLFVVVLLTALVPACRSGGPKTPAGPAVLPKPLAEYQGEYRVLPHEGDERRVRSRPGESLSGDCDVAVHVREVGLDGGVARFSLDNVGLPRVQGKEPHCEHALPGLMLLVEGLPDGMDPSEVRRRVDQMLQTPEVYLASQGITFDLPEGGAPVDIAAGDVFSGSEERSRGRHVKAWPRPLLTVNPWYHSGTDRIRQEGQVSVEVVVGTDGRIHESTVKTGMSVSQELAVKRVLPLWRFEPAKGPEGPEAARIMIEPILRIF
jgi:uncharacterized protein YjeT (DUF2065 family)